MFQTQQTHATPPGQGETPTSLPKPEPCSSCSEHVGQSVLPTHISHFFCPLLLFPLPRESCSSHGFNFLDSLAAALDFFAWPPQCHQLSDRAPSTVQTLSSILKVLLRALKAIYFVSLASEQSNSSRLLSAAWAAALISICALQLGCPSHEHGVTAGLWSGKQAVCSRADSPEFLCN